MFTVTREYWISTSHRLPFHEKCGRLHGHNYKVVVAMESLLTDDHGMVMDFHDLDKVAKPVIDALDHKFIFGLQESPLKDFPPAHQVRLPVSYTTAENLARYFYDMFKKQGHPVAYVEVWETPKSRARFDRRVWEEPARADS